MASIGSKSVGTDVYINLNGERVPVRLIHKGNPAPDVYDSSCEGAWLWLKDGYEKVQWNTSRTNDYETSTHVLALKNDMEGAFDPDIWGLIKSVKIPYRSGGGLNGTDKITADGFLCKLFDLCGGEVGYTDGSSPYFPGTGSVLEYFSGTNPGTDEKRIVQFQGVAANWWTRDPAKNSNETVFTTPVVGGNSPGYTDSSFVTAFAFIVPLNAGVREDGTLVPSLLDPPTLTVAPVVAGKDAIAIWTASVDPEGRPVSYVLEKSPDGETGWAEIYSGDGLTYSYKATEQHYLRVKAVDADGVSSDYSNVVTVFVTDASRYGRGVGNAVAVSGLTASPVVILPGVLYGRAIGGYAGKGSDLIAWTLSGTTLIRYDEKAQTEIATNVYTGSLADAVGTLDKCVWVVFYNTSRNNRPTFRKYSLETGELLGEYETTGYFNYVPVRSSVSLGSDNDTVWLASAHRSGGSSSSPDYSTYTTQLHAGVVTGPLATATRDYSRAVAEACGTKDGGCLVRATKSNSMYADQIYKYNSALTRSNFGTSQGADNTTQDPTTGDVFYYESTYSAVNKNNTTRWLSTPRPESGRKGLSATSLGLLVYAGYNSGAYLYSYSTRAQLMTVPGGNQFLGLTPQGIPLFYELSGNRIVKIGPSYEIEEVMPLKYTPSPIPQNAYRLGNGVPSWATES